ncbi:Kelch repeat-containing protein [Corallococcus silvisoli]|uniref:Kelch repeat-containing protein n=1 Tax=Corallococcus silvisoli TaxID=2697031 RepID=UPI001378C1AC|nr:kelch repeat-containing protein [Corallococcus silvisoli]NBD08456.1 hypothetical protein [Corallococcus silvisoli]
MTTARILGLGFLSAWLSQGCMESPAVHSPEHTASTKADISVASLDSTPAILTTELTQATEGVTYRRAPGVAEAILATGGTAPLQVSATGLPSGLSIDEDTGILSGIPTPGMAGSHAVDVVVTDANGQTAQATLSLEVVAPRALGSSGTVGVEPEGSPITDALTVFVIGEDGRAHEGVGVRVRKNGVEYVPAREALTDAAGRAYFTGLGLDGVSDTVDVTANGAGLSNATMARVNASRVTLLVPSYPVPLPRGSASATWDAQAGGLIMTGGQGSGANQPKGCLNDTVALTSVATGTWEEWSVPGLSTPAAPPARVGGAFQYRGSGISVLFGGESCTGSKLSDTWQFNSATRTWQQVGAPGPSVRSGAAVTASPVSGSILLFGGTSGTSSQGGQIVNNELWSYAQGWGKLSPTGTLPTARAFAAAALDTSSGLMWLCGGASSAPIGADLATCSTYNRSTNAWASATSLPAARRGGLMAYRPGAGMYLFGGSTNGAARNDLLRFSAGAWTTVTAQGAAGSPPSSGGVKLETDPSTGDLVLVMGTGTVWTFNGTAWQQRATPSSAAETVTLSGTISGGVTSGFSGATLWVVAPTGFSATTFYVALTGGVASYKLAGVPAGVPLSVYAYYESGGLYSHKDVGAVGPLVADTTLNIALEPGPLATTTTTGTLVTPADWPASINARYARGVRFQSGLPAQPNGPAESTAGTSRTFSATYIPASAPATQAVSLEAMVVGAALCETLTTWVYNPPAGAVGAVALPDGIRGVAPGLSECGTGTVPTAAEGAYQLTAPAGTELISVRRGARGMSWDWVYLSQAQAGARSFDFPQPSTLAPSRPAPSGQGTAWEVTANVFEPGSGFRYEQFESANLRPTSTARSHPRGFVRQ